MWVYPIQGYIFIIYNICINIIFIIIIIYSFFLAVSIENTSKIYPWGGVTHNIFISFQNILLYENEKILFFQKFSSIFFLLSWSPTIFFFCSVINNTPLAKFLHYRAFSFVVWSIIHHSQSFLHYPAFSFVVWTIIFQNKKVFYPAG